MVRSSLFIEGSVVNAEIKTFQKSFFLTQTTVELYGDVDFFMNL